MATPALPRAPVSRCRVECLRARRLRGYAGRMFWLRWNRLRRVVPPLDLGQPVVCGVGYASWIRADALVLEEVAVDAGRSGPQRLVVGRRPGLVDRPLGRVLEGRDQRDHDRSIAVGERRGVVVTRAIAPPRMRIWVIAIGELGARGERTGSCRPRRRRASSRNSDRVTLGARCPPSFSELVDARIRHRHGHLGQRRRDLR